MGTPEQVVMAKVYSVRDVIDTSELGVTLMHEHIFVLSPEINQNYPETWGDEDARIHDAIRQLDDLKASGVDSIVDMTVLGLGRSIHRIRRIADRVGLNILVATGIYACSELPPYFQSGTAASRTDPPKTMVDMFVRDIRTGIAGTPVRAAVLKCATDSRGLTPVAECCIRAVARAQRKTGVPISTHTDARQQGGLQQQSILKEEGVDLSQVIIGHSGDTTDLDYLERLIEKGSFIGLDRFGIDAVLSFEKRVDTVARLCRKGYAENIVLSHDTACYIDWIPEGKRKRTASNWHFLHICSDVLPALKARGVTDAQIHTMLVDNPRRIFTRS